jgi:hypothetical protein
LHPATIDTANRRKIRNYNYGEGYQQERDVIAEPLYGKIASPSSREENLWKEREQKIKSGNQ